MKKQETKTATDVICEGVVVGITATLGLTIIAALLTAFINLIH